jgi:outer membrane protein OmpA-like peptidoglycan-associated protein
VAQVTEETVTTDTARKSTEDFANKVNQAPAAAAASGTNTAVTGAIGAIVSPPAPVVVERKKRLSDVEKLLLLGAGALVVGAILSNNRKVELNSGDRVVVRRGDTYTIIKDDDALLRQPGARIRTETFTDGSTRSTVLREDGSRIVTIRDAEMRVLRRVHVAPDGYETMLIDDTVAYQPVDVRRLPKPRPRPVLTSADDDAALRAALDQTTDAGRRFSLAQVRDIAEVRALAPEIDLTAITFASGSAAIRPDQARALSGLGKLIQAYVRDNPREVFLIEGHTDAVGSAAYNLALSDRRAVKLQRLVAASALLCGRTQTTQADFWVLRYIWDTEDQREVLHAIVQDAIEKATPEEKKGAHPRTYGDVPNGEELAREIGELAAKLGQPQITTTEAVTIRDQLGLLAARIPWIADEQQRKFLQQELDAAWALAGAKA